MPRRRTISFSGIDASPGICVGLVYFADRRRLQIPKVHIPDDQIQSEIGRLRDATGLGITQLEKIRKKVESRRGQEPKAIIEAHLLMMQDEALVKGTEKLIEAEAINAEWALSKNVLEIRKVFDALEDDYFRERRSDVEFVGQRIMHNLMGREPEMKPPPHERAVIIARDLSPADTAIMSRKKVAGFVTEIGGKTSHTAIIARSMELPAVVGADGILSKVGSGDRIIVDGYRGEVILHPTEKAIRDALARSQGLRTRAAELVSKKALPAKTLDGHQVMLSANMELVDEVDSALRYGAEGVGLFRTEFMFLGKRPPSEGYQRKCYCKILRKMKNRPVAIRTLDIGGDKNLPFINSEPEVNPALGLRSIRLSLRKKKIFMSQLRALLRASVEGRLKIMFPMICCIQELRQAKEMLEEAKSQLKAKGQPYSRSIKIGMMIEVPSAAMMSDTLAKEVDFFSIGTNDLIQFMLAVDRHNEQVAYLFNPLHVSVLRLLDLVIKNAHKAGIPVAMCGEMAGDPLYLHILLGLGLDEISMNPHALLYARHLIRASKKKDVKKLTRQVMQMDNSIEIQETVQQWMFERFPDFFTPEGHADILGGL
jgi:phosphotransferase system enzyme I (PtsI)